MSPNKPMIITHSYYLDSCNANFCGGVMYACTHLNEVVNKPKATKKEILKALDSMYNEAEKVRKELTFNGKKTK